MSQGKSKRTVYDLSREELIALSDRDLGRRIWRVLKDQGYVAGFIRRQGKLERSTGDTLSDLAMGRRKFLPIFDEPVRTREATLETVWRLAAFGEFVAAGAVYKLWFVRAQSKAGGSWKKRSQQNRAANARNQRSKRVQDRHRLIIEHAIDKAGKRITHKQIARIVPGASPRSVRRVLAGVKRPD